MFKNSCRPGYGTIACPVVRLPFTEVTFRSETPESSLQANWIPFCRTALSICTRRVYAAHPGPSSAAHTLHIPCSISTGLKTLTKELKQIPSPGNVPTHRRNVNMHKEILRPSARIIHCLHSKIQRFGRFFRLHTQFDKRAGIFIFPALPFLAAEYCITPVNKKLLHRVKAEPVQKFFF